MHTGWKKRISAALLALGMVLMLAPAAFAETTVWNGSAADGFSGGTGAEDDPFLILTAEQLKYFADRVGSGDDFRGKYVVLGANILLNDTAKWKSWDTTAPANVWAPIGTFDCPFAGVFDGRGYYVSGVYMDAEENCLGLFGYAQNAVITGVGVEKSFIRGSYQIGGVLGCNIVTGGKSEVVDCCFAGDLRGIESVAGGVVGYCHVSDGGVLTVKNCLNEGSVSGGSDVGGVVGCVYVIEADATVDHCRNTGKVSGEGWLVGGVVSVIDASDGTVTVTGCCNTGNVTGGGYVGGVIGFGEAIDGGKTEVRVCYNTGDVLGESGIGGVVGSQYSPSGTVAVACCYNTGDVSGKESVGGVVGSNEAYAFDGGAGKAGVTDCYSIGVVCGTVFVGGVIGNNSADGEGSAAVPENCYYRSDYVEDGKSVPQYGIGCDAQGEANADISGQTAGLTAEEMQRAESFAAFDFEAVWSMEGNPAYSYPELSDVPMVKGNPAAWEIKTGDVNGSDSLDAYDYQMLKAYVLGTLKNVSGRMKKNMDINHDKKIDSYDYQMLKAAVLGTYTIK